MLDVPADKAGAARGILRRPGLWIAASTVGIAAYALLSTDLPAGVSQLRFAPAYWLLAFALMLLPWVFNAIRIDNWLRFLGYGRSFRGALRAVVVSDLSAAVMPRAVGAAPARVGLLVAAGVAGSHAGLILMLSALEDAVFTFVAAPLLLTAVAVWRIPAIPHPTPQATLAAIACALALLAIGWRVPRIRNKSRALISDLGAAFALIARQGKRVWLVNIGWMLLQWTARYSIAAAVIAGLGIHCDFWHCLALQWLCFALMNLTPTPASVGGAEASFLLLYNGVLPSGLLPLAALGWRFFTFYLPTAMAAIAGPLLAIVTSRYSIRTMRADALHTPSVSRAK